MSPPRPLRRLPAAPTDAPCSAAVEQLAYEQPYTDAQKLEFAFRFALRNDDALHERLQLDRQVAEALELLRAEQRLAAGRAEQLAAAVGELVELVRQDLLASDCYSAQAVESLDRLCVGVRELSRRLQHPPAAGVPPPPTAIVVIGRASDDDGTALERAA